MDFILSTYDKILTCKLILYMKKLWTIVYIILKSEK